MLAGLSFLTLFQVCYQEEASEVWFPELQDLPSSVTYMDMRLIGHQRLSALGCQNGYLKCALVDLTAPMDMYPDSRCIQVKTAS